MSNRASPVRTYAQSPAKTSVRKLNSSALDIKDLETSKKYQTPSKKRVNFDLGNSYQTPKNDQLARSSYMSGGYSGSSVRKSGAKSPAKTAENEALSKALKEQMDIDKELEACKNELSLRSDFNLLDAFRFFDQQGKGYVTKTELKDGFNYFEIYPTNSEAYLIMRKYDRDNDGLLR